MLVTTRIHICRAVPPAAVGSRTSFASSIHAQAALRNSKNSSACRIESERTQTKSSSTEKQRNFVLSARILSSMRPCSDIVSRRWRSAIPMSVRYEFYGRERGHPTSAARKGARLDTVARELGMSSRTLARRLTAEGLNLLSGSSSTALPSRHALLRSRTFAFLRLLLVGYQGVGAFSHRCKRWTRMNPKRIRNKLLASDRAPFLWPMTWPRGLTAAHCKSPRLGSSQLSDPFIQAVHPESRGAPLGRWLQGGRQAANAYARCSNAHGRMLRHPQCEWLLAAEKNIRSCNASASAECVLRNGICQARRKPVSSASGSAAAR